MDEKLLNLSVNDQTKLSQFNPSAIFDTKKLVEAIVETEIFYSNFKILNEHLRKLESRLWVKSLVKVKLYLDEIYNTWDMNSSIEWLSFLHFLVKEYYLNIDTNLSITFEIFELIEKTLNNTLFDINTKDLNGDTLLMRLYFYIKETNEKVKNWNKGIILGHLYKLVFLLESKWGVITLTPNQESIVDKISTKSVDINSKNITTNEMPAYVTKERSTWFYAVA